jgi:hypothetical protein
MRLPKLNDRATYFVPAASPSSVSQSLAAIVVRVLFAGFADLTVFDLTSQSWVYKADVPQDNSSTVGPYFVLLD